MLSGFFTLAAAQSEGYDRVVLLAPSHFAKDFAGPVVTAYADWDTPFGTVQGDSAAVATLLGDPTLGARQDASVLELDHAVAGLVPYVAHYLPNTRLAACMLVAGTSMRRLDALAELLLSFCADGCTLFIVTVDFSHYLQPGQAAARDEETMRAIEALDYLAVAQFTDENVDSSECLGLFLKINEAMHTQVYLMDHAASVDKLPPGTDISEGITTYLIYGGYL